MELYREKDFYKENGWPPEEYSYCDFVIPVGSETEYGRDYDQFILVVNSLNPYLRLSKKRRKHPIKDIYLGCYGVVTFASAEIGSFSFGRNRQY